MSYDWNADGAPEYQEYHDEREEAVTAGSGELAMARKTTIVEARVDTDLDGVLDRVYSAQASRMSSNSLPVSRLVEWEGNATAGRWRIASTELASGAFDAGLLSSDFTETSWLYVASEPVYSYWEQSDTDGDGVADVVEQGLDLFDDPVRPEAIAALVGSGTMADQEAHDELAFAGITSEGSTASTEGISYDVSADRTFTYETHRTWTRSQVVDAC
ncbi:MAG: hypothetical protein Q6370_001550, partial [Candidatus Sigynarchaeota archaeon]